jgi:hypothetical protein
MCSSLQDSNVTWPCRKCSGAGRKPYFISLTAPGAFASTGGVRYLVDTAPVCTTSNGALLPFNWTQVVKVAPGEKLSTVSNDGVGGTLVVVELTN